VQASTVQGVGKAACDLFTALPQQVLAALAAHGARCFLHGSAHFRLKVFQPPPRGLRSSDQGARSGFMLNDGEFAGGVIAFVGGHALNPGGSFAVPLAVGMVRCLFGEAVAGEAANGEAAGAACGDAAVAAGALEKADGHHFEEHDRSDRRTPAALRSGFGVRLAQKVDVFGEAHFSEHGLSFA
jgi:hypothetical protein